MCTAALGLLSALRLGQITGPICVGMLAGIACGLKIHGGFYLLGPLLYLWARYGWRGWIIAGATGLGALFAPFLIRDISIADYRDSLAMTASHGLTLSHFFENVQWAVFLFVPVFLPIASSTPFSFSKLERSDRWLFAGLCLGTAVVVVLGSKAGAGPWHLMPFLPPLGYFSFRGSESAKTELEKQAENASGDFLPSMRLGWFALAAFLAVTTHYRHVPPLLRSDAAAVVQELKAVQVTHPGKTIQMGYGDALDGPRYQITTYRALLVFWGQPYTFDASALMDRGGAEIPFPRELTSDLEAGKPDLVLIPKGNRPFRQLNFFDRMPLFPPEFISAFEANYCPTESGNFFDVWVFKGHGAL